MLDWLYATCYSHINQSMVAELELGESLHLLLDALSPFQSPSLAAKVRERLEHLPAEQRKSAVETMIATYDPPVAQDTRKRKLSPYAGPSSVDLLASLYEANETLNIVPGAQIALHAARAARHAVESQQKIMESRQKLQAKGDTFYANFSVENYAQQIRLPQLRQLAAFAPAEGPRQTVKPLGRRRGTRS